MGAASPLATALGSAPGCAWRRASAVWTTRSSASTTTRPCVLRSSVATWAEASRASSVLLLRCS
ncbi:hypothetical protein PF005_g33368 [Phytophthora fragariae]|uniref:Uncharacterized protein n=1 Tax=Phytophthora fragariae TaxID=53985 RepID=A0A6A3UUJ7_9STRA|nr:hypothetical protein PF009_g33158 [Phytophthora fragariae]KAE9054439.1 hypothetical protein PF006_g33257 [Phytophthora fragariae]KAE9155339.1 hypothetical protein PF005_g33368 [Phytophthora fragariae]KAE9258934.1 hypothetical protein PF001_g33196 [Phytophthora fragariae]